MPAEPAGPEGIVLGLVFAITGVGIIVLSAAGGRFTGYSECQLASALPPHPEMVLHLCHDLCIGELVGGLDFVHMLGQ